MAIAPVVIEFLAKGLPQVQAAFKSIQDSAIKSERAQSAEVEKSERTRTASVEKWSKYREKIVERSATMTGFWAKRVAKEEETAARKSAAAAKKAADDKAKLGRDELTAAERIEKAKTAAAEKWAKKRVQIQDQSATMAGNLAKKQAKDEEAAARKAANAKIADSKRVTNELDKAQRKLDSYQAKSHRETLKAESQQETRDARTSRAQGRVVGAIVGAGARGVISGLQRAGNVAMGLAGTTAQLGGGFDLGDSVARAGSLDLSARQLMNSAKDTGGFTLEDIKNRAKGASITTGLEAEDLVHATKAYTAKSADFAGGMENMEFFGKLAKSSGTNVEDVARAAGIMRVQNETLNPAAMKQMMLDMLAQGKEGSVEIDDLAAMAGKATRTSAAYGGRQTDSQRSLLGLTQIAMATSGKDPNEAATTVSNLSSDATKNSDKVRALLGKDFLNKQGQIDSTPENFIADVMSASGGNLQKIQAAGFGIRSQKMFQALAPDFHRAGGGEAGREKILEKMHKVTDATYTQEHVDSDLKNILDAPAEKFAAAMRELRTVAGEQLLPEFIKMIPALKELGPQFVEFAKIAIPAFTELMGSVASLAKTFDFVIEGVAAHPVGALIALEVTKSFATAGLPALLRGLYGGAFTGGAGGASASKLPVGGSPLAALAITAGVVTIVTGALNEVDDVLEARNEGKRRAKEASEMDPDKMAVEVAKAQSVAGDGQTAAAYGSKAQRALEWIMNPLAAAGNKAVEAGSEYLGLDTVNTTAKEAIASREMLTVLKTIAENTANGNKSGTHGAARSEPIISR